MPDNEKEAIEYAKSLTELHGVKWIPFKSPKNSDAYKMGVKFGACEETERDIYVSGGCTIIGE